MGELAGDTCMTEEMRAGGEGEAVDAGDDTGAAAAGRKRPAERRGKRGARKAGRNSERSDACHEQTERRKRDTPGDEQGEGRGAGRAGGILPPMLRRRATEAQEEGEP